MIKRTIQLKGYILFKLFSPFFLLYCSMIHKALYDKYGKVTNVRVEKGEVKFDSNKNAWTIKSKPNKSVSVSVPLNELIKNDF